jgi:hypothetical protein
MLTPEYLVVIDDMEAESPRRFNWMYHNYGSEALADGVRLEAGEVLFRGGEYLERVVKGMTDQSFQIQFVGEDVTTTLWMTSAPGTQVLTADGPGETVMERIPMTMVTREGTSAQFVAVLEPVPNLETPHVSQVSAALDAATKTVQIAYGDREDILTFTADETLTFTVDGEQVLSDEDREK